MKASEAILFVGVILEACVLANVISENRKISIEAHDALSACIRSNTRNQQDFEMSSSRLQGCEQTLKSTNEAFTQLQNESQQTQKIFMEQLEKCKK
jgi:hypothetical protein